MNTSYDFNSFGIGTNLSALTASSGLRPAKAQNNAHDPTWWSKYEFILNQGSDGDGGSTASVSLGSNVDVSNECGPQSETFITLDPNKPRTLAAGSNEIFRFADAWLLQCQRGNKLGGVDLPRAAAKIEERD